MSAPVSRTKRRIRRLAGRPDTVRGLYREGGPFRGFEPLLQRHGLDDYAPADALQQNRRRPPRSELLVPFQERGQEAAIPGWLRKGAQLPEGGANSSRL